jgi:hypothetical protein
MPCAREGRRPIATERVMSAAGCHFTLREGSLPDGRDRAAGSGRSLEPGRTASTVQTRYVTAPEGRDGKFGFQGEF